MSPEVETARSLAIERLMLTHPAYDESYDRIVRLLKMAVGTSAAAFTVLDGTRQFFKAKEGLDLRETTREVSFCTHTIEQEGLMVVPDAHQDIRFSSNPLVTSDNGIGFYAGMPVRTPSGLALGALCAIDTQPREFTPAQCDAIRDLRAVLEEVILLRSLSVIDPLTSLTNRRYFEDITYREWKRGITSKAPSALLMLGVDCFKLYNDHYGHSNSDVCLKAVAGALRNGARRVGDVVSRVGGDKFALLLPNISSEGAQLQAERLRREVVKLDLPHAGSPLGKVSVSIGVAMVEDSQQESYEASLHRAEQALGEARARGRNRTMLSLPTAEGAALLQPAHALISPPK